VYAKNNYITFEKRCPVVSLAPSVSGSGIIAQVLQEIRGDFPKPFKLYVLVKFYVLQSGAIRGFKVWCTFDNCGCNLRLPPEYAPVDTIKKT